MSGFFPSAETMKIGLVDANVGLQINSSGVTARETRPVNASCKLQSREDTVNDPPEPTAMILASLAAAIAVLSFLISADVAASTVSPIFDSSCS
jgi:hypothetical protein